MNKVFLFDLIFLVVMFAACKGQHNSDGICLDYIKTANVMIRTYASTGDKDFLTTALYSLDSAMHCKETRAKAMALKIQVYTLKEDTEAAIGFIASLEEKDFDRPYKKKMYTSFFKASSLNLETDSLIVRTMYANTANEIENYINNFPKVQRDSIDKISYADLFFILSKYKSKAFIKEKINELIKAYHGDSAFLYELRETAIANAVF
jgi:hypothetical protein